MKYILTASLILACFTYKLHAQQFNVRGKCRSSIETSGSITLSSPSVTLKNVSLTCDTLWLDNTLSTLNIAGQVTIVCNVLIIGNNTTNAISLEKSGLNKSQLTIQCPAEKIFGRRPLQPGRRAPAISGLKPDK